MRPDLGEGGGLRPVVDLLVEQVETADILLLNKAGCLDPHGLDRSSRLRAYVEQLLTTRCADPSSEQSDLMAPGDMDQLVEIVATLNPLGKVMVCSRGEVPVDTIFSGQIGPDTALVAGLNIEGHHRGAVAAARAQERRNTADGAGDGGHHHHHQHGHGHGHKHDDCDECK